MNLWALFYKIPCSKLEREIPLGEAPSKYTTMAFLWGCYTMKSFFTKVFLELVMWACKVDTNIELLVFSIRAKDKLKFGFWWEEKKKKKDMFKWKRVCFPLSLRQKGQKVQKMTCHTKSLAMTPLGKAQVWKRVSQPVKCRILHVSCFYWFKEIQCLRN